MKKISLIIFLILITMILGSCESKREIKKGEDAVKEKTQSEYLSNHKKDTPKNSIGTKDFHMIVPEFWVGKYTFNLSEDGEELTVRMITKKGGKNGHLFTIYIIPTSDVDNIEGGIEFGIEPIGLLKNEYGDEYFLGLWYASEMACDESEEEVFLSLIDSIPEIIKTLSPSKGCEISEWDNKYLSEYDDAPYVFANISILGRSFQSFKNQSNDVVYKMENPRMLDAYHVTANNDIEYYYSGKKELIGVENGVIVLYSIPCENLVREVLNSFGLNSFFDVTPKFLSVDNRAVGFYYWSVNNGYAGITAVGGNDPQNCYNYKAMQFIVLSRRELINI